MGNLALGRGILGVSPNPLGVGFFIYKMERLREGKGSWPEPSPNRKFSSCLKLP